MADLLKARIKQQKDFESPSFEARLNLLVAADAIRAPMDALCAKFDITQGQYNVLRILRGAGNEGHPRCEIAERMVQRAPDITRLIDRLEKQKLVERLRSDKDRRFSVAKISLQGLALLDEIEPELEKSHQRLTKRLSTAEWIALTSLCEKIYVEPKEIEEED